MKIAMSLLLTLLFSVSASAATLTLSPTVSGQIVTPPNSSSVIGFGSDEGTWSSYFTLKSDEDVLVSIDWDYNPDNNVKKSTFVFDSQKFVAKDLIKTFSLLAGQAYNIGFENIETSAPTAYSVSVSTVSAVPVPAAALLFAPSLMGFVGLRRKLAA